MSPWVFSEQETTRGRQGSMHRGEAGPGSNGQTVAQALVGGRGEHQPKTERGPGLPHKS